jgi:hypothetical protein
MQLHFLSRLFLPRHRHLAIDCLSIVNTKTGALSLPPAGSFLFARVIGLLCARETTVRQTHHHEHHPAHHDRHNDVVSNGARCHFHVWTIAGAADSGKIAMFVVKNRRRRSSV